MSGERIRCGVIETDVSLTPAQARALKARWEIPSDPNPMPRLRLWGRRRETLSDDRSQW